MNAVVLHALCFVIVALWLVLRIKLEDDRRGFLVRLACVSVAAWICEDTCIRLYGFYSYAPQWVGFIDQVPIAIVCIWPVVVMSAIDGARAFLPRASPHARALLVMVLVTTDASMIEPIAVSAGLWSWTEPGPFEVPIIGILGWGFFALGAAYAVERGRPLLALPLGLLTTHALLLAGWWGALKWLPRGEDELPFVVGAWIASIALTAFVIKRNVTAVRRDLLLRVPAASFFFVLLALYARDDVMLLAYACAFVPPYLALTARANTTGQLAPKV
jgi:hypothetical protein